MRNLFRITFAYLLAAASISLAGILTPGLEEQYRTAGETEFLPVLIVVADGVRGASESLTLERTGLSLSHVHRQIMDDLQTTASTRQVAVQKSLAVITGNGQARAVKPFWIANVIAAELTRDAAILIANTDDVLEVGLDPQIQLVPLIDDASATATHAADNRGVRGLWSQGIFGAGRTVCVMGEAFRAQHAALSASYRGTSSVESESFFDPIPIRTRQYCGDHSNRVVSTICGIAGVDTLGVAPGARWMAADIFVCGKSRLSMFMQALEWAVDADQNSSTTADVPDAIVCPWTWDARCYGSAPANITDVFENAEALGPVLIFAANNTVDGDPQFLGPASLDAGLAVGNSSSDGNVHPSSARGPSGCDARVSKPDLVALGTAVICASPDATSGTAASSSTAIASGSVAGCVALLRELYPNLSAQKIRQGLTKSALDLGASGPDAIFGYGQCDVETAAQIVAQLGATGELQVVVRYGGTGIPDAKVTVQSATSIYYAQTNDAGVALFNHLPANQNYAVNVGRFSYTTFSQPDSVLVVPKRMNDLFVNLSRGYFDDAELDQGWQTGVGSDNATGGSWVRTEPVATFAEGSPVQPAKAFDGTMCFVTGNGTDGAEAGQSDVDGGVTTLRSPEFSLVEMSHPVLTFHYWFSNDKGPNRGGDFFRAQLSNDGGQSWINLINTSTSTGEWKTATVNVEDVCSTTRRMVLQFTAEDQGAGSLVEAAVDRIEIIGDPVAPEPPQGLMIDVQFDQVVLNWRPSRGATLYKIYVADDPESIVKPERFIFSTGDTTATIPLSTIPFDVFYFAVTASN